MQDSVHGYLYLNRVQTVAPIMPSAVVDYYSILLLLPVVACDIPKMTKSTTFLNHKVQQNCLPILAKTVKGR